MPLRPLRLLGTFLVSASLLAMTVTPGAFGQEEGVTLDPSDPAAKEYSLPHDEARREASGQSGERVTQGSNDAALFGEGVSRDDAAKPSSTGSGSSGGSSSAADSGEADPTATTAVAGGGAGPGGESSATTEAGGIGSTTAMVGGGLIALLAAGFGGLALRAIRGPADA